MILPTGKLDSDLLKRIVFGKIKYRSEDVKVRPGIGEDCAVMDFGEFDCVMSTDPISSAVNDIGRLAIHITCNDIASNGVQPLGIMLAVMLPEGTTDADVEHIMEQAAATAAEVNVEIIGGHTEITPAVKQPVIVSTAIGKTLAGTSQSGDDMIPGDYIMMTKAAGLEGSGIIACDYPERLRQEVVNVAQTLAGPGAPSALGALGASGAPKDSGSQGVSATISDPGAPDDSGAPDDAGAPGDAGAPLGSAKPGKTGGATVPLFSEVEILRAQSFLDRVSVVKEGVAAGRVGTHGMHDITEGGILGAIWEMCQISGTGAEVWEEKIPMEPETKKICQVFDIDPLRLISSGSMVIIVPKEKRAEMEQAMEEAGVPASIIGVIREASEGVRLIRRIKTCGAEGEGRVSVAVDPPYADEIYKVVGRL